MNDLSTVFPSDPDVVALERASPLDAPMAMPTQQLEAQRRSVLTAMLTVFRPARQPSRGV